jgi:hypothetical protein
LSVATDTDVYAEAAAAAEAASAAECSRLPRSRRGGDPAVSVVVAVHGSEGTVLIDYRWETLTGVELAVARRAGSPA